MITRKNTRPFGFRDKLGYLFGDFGNDFTFILSSSFLLKFYTDVMGVDAFIVGIVMMVARFVDAFTDVAMGRICDKRKNTKHGKFRPWLRWICAPVAISSFLIYQSGLASAPMGFKIFWLFATYILWSSIFYTAINIPYGSMASALSAEPDERQSLSTFRTLGGTLAGVIIGAGVPLFAFTKNSEGQFVLNGGRFTLIAGIFSLLAIGAYLLCYTLTTERVQFTEQRKREEYKLGTMLKNAVRNRALLSIIVASIVMLLAQLTMQSMAGYIYPNYYNNTTAQSASTIVMMGSMVFAASIAKPLARKFGKAEISVFSNGLAAAVCLLLFFWRPQNVWVYVVVSGVGWIGLGLFAMVSWALITDVIDYSEIKHGIREDGTTYALYSFARKLGQAGAAGLTGGLLSLIGYSDLTQTAPSVLKGIYNISTLVPALGFALLALVLWFWYPLHKKQVEQNVAYLKKKREESAGE